MMNKVCPQFGRRHSFWSLSLPIQIYLPASKFAYSICDSRCSPPKPHSFEEPRGWKMGKWISKKAHSFFSPTLWVHHTLSLFVCSQTKAEVQEKVSTGTSQRKPTNNKCWKLSHADFNCHRIFIVRSISKRVHQPTRYIYVMPFTRRIYILPTTSIHTKIRIVYFVCWHFG